MVDHQYIKRRRINSAASDSGMTEEIPELNYLRWPSIYIHGGYSINPRTKKKTFSHDLHYINTETGLVRKFFLFDAGKGRA